MVPWVLAETRAVCVLIAGTIMRFSLARSTEAWDAAACLHANNAVPTASACDRAVWHACMHDHDHPGPQHLRMTTLGLNTSVMVTLGLNTSMTTVTLTSWTSKTVTPL